MPEKAHRALEREADKKGLTGEHRKRYIWGTLNRIEKGKGRSKPMPKKRSGGRRKSGY